MLKYHRFLKYYAITLKFTMNMFISKKTLIFLLFSAIAIIQAEIFEIKHFHETLKYINTHDLVLLDIDNTLLEPHDRHNQITSDQWFTTLVKQMPNFQEALEHYCSSVLTHETQPVEPTIPSILSSIQQHATVLGFTMRSIILAPRTVQQLTQHAIMLAHQFSDRGFMVDNKHPVMVYHDIIFCQGHKNGITLFTVLDSYAIKPKTIIMVDDKRSYLESVEKECQKYGIKFIGLRYGFLDEKVAAFLKITHL